MLPFCEIMARQYNFVREPTLVPLNASLNDEQTWVCHTFEWARRKVGRCLASSLRLPDTEQWNDVSGVISEGNVTRFRAS